MSGFRLVPTFRLARRIAQDQSNLTSVNSVFSRHWKNMMDHHLGMMETMLDHGVGDSRSPWSRRRWLDDAFNAPSWWKTCEGITNQSSSAPAAQAPAKREFGRVDFGQDAKKFELVIDLGEHNMANDVKVSVQLVDDHELHVKAHYETKSEETGEFRRQYFSKVMSLPAVADVEGLKSTITEEGLLKIEAPMLAIEELTPTPVREIPIERSSAALPEEHAEKTTTTTTTDEVKGK